jgi:hypothetical protein
LLLQTQTATRAVSIATKPRDAGVGLKVEGMIDPRAFQNLIRDKRETPSKRDASKSNTGNLPITSAVGERLEAADCQKDIYIFQFTAGNFSINATIADSFPN